MLEHGVQTDGSSVHLPKIAELNNAKVDMIPDKSVNWYVDYNFDNVSKEDRASGGDPEDTVFPHPVTTEQRLVPGQYSKTQWKNSRAGSWSCSRRILMYSNISKA